MVDTPGNDAPSYATVKRWVAHFKVTILALVDLHFQNSKQNKQQYFTGFRYQ